MFGNYDIGIMAMGHWSFFPFFPSFSFTFCDDRYAPRRVCNFQMNICLEYVLVLIVDLMFFMDAKHKWMDIN